MRFSVLLSLLLLFSGSLYSATIHVPADQPTIQAGIDAAIPGDTVLVADGTYTGDGNRDIDFGGKGVVLKSENGPQFTVIDCEGSSSDPHRGFTFHSGEDSSAVVDGFTIKNGNAFGGSGGGISCSGSSPTISNNIISGNSGGGIFCVVSSPTISNNTISRNSVLSGNGGGIYCRDNSNPNISNNIISGNLAFGAGGGIICLFNSSPTISNNTISGNSASWGGGIYCSVSDPTISNNTISGNSGGGLYLAFNSSPSLVNTIITFNVDGEAVSCDGSNNNPSLTCCDIYGNVGGDWVGCIADQSSINGNFSADPLFCDTAAGDYHLDGFSPCAATFNNCGVLIGALDVGCESFVCADANGDGQVNYDDLDFLITYYFAFGPAPEPATVSDLNIDGMVDLGDIVYLANFLNGIGPAPCAGSEPPPGFDWKKEPEGIGIGTE